MEKKEKKQVYEVGYHLVSSIAEEGVPAEVEALKKLLTGAEIIAEENPKLTDLAYTIVKQIGGLRRKYDKAYFGWVKFEAETSDLATIKKGLDEMESVLRYLLIKTVRENTMYGAKLVAAEEGAKKKYTRKEEKTDKPASEEEINKAVDELIKE
jgi:ribosomal protein S6